MEQDRTQTIFLYKQKLERQAARQFSRNNKSYKRNHNNSRANN